jgi:hypothetical protein
VIEVWGIFWAKDRIFLFFEYTSKKIYYYNENSLKLSFLLLLVSFLSLQASSYIQLFDAVSNQMITQATISDSTKLFHCDSNGTFAIESSEDLFHIKAYGYRPLSFTKQDSNATISLQPIEVKALYLNFWVSNITSSRAKKALRMIQESQLNAVIVDIKNEEGATSFLTSFDQANTYGAHEKRTNRDIEAFMKYMKDNNIYTIARIVTFKDELQASHNPDYAVKKKDGTIWRNHDNMAWVDPFDKRSHLYAIAMAEEAAKVGFDEINFDYIRFPAKQGLIFSKESTPKNRMEAIESFLALAQERLRKYGVFISADTYGNICWGHDADDDNNIGQTVASLAKHADYLAPMLYPSGFAPGSFGFDAPSEHPYAVLFRSIKNMHDRIEAIRVRPWLQHFKDYAHKKRDYKEFELQEQIRACDDANTSGWMVWSPSSKYHTSYFER